MVECIQKVEEAMGKYLIKCSMTVPYTMVVEAPTEEAARLFYGACDGSELNRGDDDGWELDFIIRENPQFDPGDADYTVDEEGEEI